MNSFDYNSLKLGQIIKYHNVFKFSEWPISQHAFRSYCPLLKTLPYLYEFGGGGGPSVSYGHISSFNLKSAGFLIFLHTQGKFRHEEISVHRA